MNNKIIRPGEYDYFETLQILKSEGNIKELFSQMAEMLQDSLKHYGSNKRRFEIFEQEVERFHKNQYSADGAILPHYPRKLIHLRETQEHIKLRLFIQLMNRPFNEMEGGVFYRPPYTQKPIGEMTEEELRPFVHDELSEIIKNSGFSVNGTKEGPLSPIKVDLERGCVGFLYYQPNI